MTAVQEQKIKEEFKSFTAPRKFRGGCKQSKSLPGFCVHFNFQGVVGQIEENCKSSSGCKGYDFKYNV